MPQQFFPSSDRPELLVDVRLPEGASFEATLRQAKRLEKALEGRPEIDHYGDFVGTGAPRFYLPLDQQLQQPNFAQFVITAKSVEDREKLARWLEPDLREQVSGGAHASVAARKRSAGRLSGAVPRERRRYCRPCARSPKGRRDDARRHPRTRNVQFDWDEPAERSVRFEIDQKKARELGVSSEDVSNFLAMTLSGYTVTQYRERDKLISVDLRAPKSERVDPAQLATLGHADAERPGAARHARACAQRPRIRRDLATRPAADDHRAVRRRRPARKAST